MVESTILRLVLFTTGALGVAAGAILTWLYGAPLGVAIPLLGTVAAGTALAARAEGRMTPLRIAEAAVFGGVAGLVAAIAGAGIADGAPEAAAAGFRSAAFGLALVVVLHGVVVPHRWRGAGIVQLALLAIGAGGLYAGLVAAAPAHARAIPGADLAGTAALLAISLAIAIAAAALVSAFRELAVSQRVLNMYELTEMIGSGGMGEVWRAEHKRLSRPAAIKLIRRDMLGSPELAEKMIARFELEARTTAHLRSPNTVEVYDFGTAGNGTFFYVMEYLEGLDLETLVDRHGALPSARVIHILRQVCDSIGEAHDAGLIHRDIKPANISIGQMGLAADYVKVLDFGLVKLAEPEASVTTSVAHEVTGTPAFLAPEMVAGDGKISAAADIYSIGCVGYWLLTGELVFDEPTAMKMAIAHATYPPIPPSERLGQPLPAELDRIILRCLDKDPAARYRSARELAAALAACPIQVWTAEQAEAWWRMLRPDGA